MKKLLLGAVLLLALVGVVNPAAAQGDEYRRQLGKLLEMSGSLAAVDVILDQLIPAMKQITIKDTPADFWDDFKTRWNRKTRHKLVDIYVPIYQKHLTLDDLNKVVAFFESPVGKKLAAATPAMTLEGMQAGQQLGMQIAQEMMKEMEELGYK